MDFIYKQAQAILLAVAGKGSAFGLSEAGTRYREQQPAAVTGRHTICSTLAHPEVILDKSTWMTRGWTYQEAMLSTRRIFFTEQQVYYECNGMQCSEALPPDLEQWHAEDKQGFRDGVSHQIFELSTLNLALFDVWVYIAAYSSRELSYDGDSLNGFLGILAFLETPETTLRNFWRMPITTQFDYFNRGTY